jgi:hypothetical protein
MSRTTVANNAPQRRNFSHFIATFLSGFDFSDFGFADSWIHALAHIHQHLVEGIEPYEAHAREIKI